jgi:hypothetical protein
MRNDVRLAGAAAVAVAFVVAGCGSSHSDKAEQEIKKGLAKQTGSNVEFVDCPDKVQLRQGGVFRCKAVVPVTVTQIDKNGSIRWQITSFSGRPPTGATVGPTQPGQAGQPAAGAQGRAPNAGAAAGQTGAASPQLTIGRLGLYRDRKFGYELLRPVVWRKKIQEPNVIFSSPQGAFIHIYAYKGTLPKLSQLKKTVRQDKRNKITAARRIKVSGQAVNTVFFTLQLSPTLKQVIFRYQFGHGKKIATVDFARTAGPVPKGYVQFVHKAVKSLTWR